MTTEKEDIFKIYELEKFKDFISERYNQDIIFSAPFGTGKTHFLKNVFSMNEDIRKHYNIIHLFPVNYVVASNDDIFDLIKYDILMEMKMHFPELFENTDSLEFSKLLAIQGYLLGEFRPFDFVRNLIMKSGLINKAPFKVYDLFKDEIEKFNVYNKTLQGTNEENIIKLMAELASNIKLTEIDAISRLIVDANNIAKKEDKTNVLIIDDLDRIDPEHIFRIINVFSAHRDYSTQEHKFGFDKVILVCDISNIRRIYEHRYGIGVDFNGYISKFADTMIFNYNVKRYLSDALDQIFLGANYTSLPAKLIEKDENYVFYDFGDPKNIRNNTYYLIFKFFVNFLIDNSKINIRDLTKKYIFIVQNEILKNNRGQESNKLNFPILVIIDYLDTILGGKKSFLEAIISCTSKGNILSLHKSPSKFIDSQHIITNILEELLTLIIMPLDEISNTYTITIKDTQRFPVIDQPANYSFNIPYKSERNFHRRNYRINIISHKLEWEKLTFYNINELVIDTLREFYTRHPSY